MNNHDSWLSDSGARAVEPRRMDELTSRQLADELTSLASSMFGLLQPQTGTSLAPDEPEYVAAAPEMPLPSVPVPASLPMVAVPHLEDWEPSELRVADPAVVFAAIPFETPSVVLPELPFVDETPTNGFVEDEPLQVPTLMLLPEPDLALELEPGPVFEPEPVYEFPPVVEPEPEPVFELQPVVEPDPEPEPLVETPAPIQRRSMTLLNEIAFLDD